MTNPITRIRGLRGKATQPKIDDNGHGNVYPITNYQDLIESSCCGRGARFSNKNDGMFFTAAMNLDWPALEKLIAEMKGALEHYAAMDNECTKLLAGFAATPDMKADTPANKVLAQLEEWEKNDG